MAHLSFGNLELSVTGGPARAARPSDETPFRLLILGDFSGRANRAIVEPLRARRAAPVDCDNFDALLARLHPQLTLPAGKIAFGKLDDFHPDRLFTRLPFFARLTESRAGVQNPATWREAAAGWSVAPAAAELTPAAQPSAAPAEDDSALFERLLGRAPTPPAVAAPKPAGQLDDLLRGMIAPHIVPGPEPAQATMVAAVDAAIGEQMRALLHDPAFQALEATWRGLDFLVRNLDTDETLTLRVLDVSKAELAADLAGEDLAASALHQLFAGDTIHTPGGEPSAAIIGLHAFSPAQEADAALLGRLAKVAAAAGAPFLAAAAPGEPGAAWAALRGLREASHLGLVTPRFLLRLPYGAQTEPIDRFAFEEMPTGPEQQAYLWGNGALIAACLLGEAFRENGWEMSPDDCHEVTGLPVHTFKGDDGEKHATPCGEHWLKDRDAEALLTQGLMPLMSIRGRDAVRLVRFQSLAEPPRLLTGRWAGS